MKTTKRAVLTAADLMQTTLVRIEPESTLEEAAALLDDAGISGAPVVDVTGRLIGVISVRDLARRASFGARESEARRGWDVEEMEAGDVVERDISMADDYSPANVERLRVRDCMSGNVVSVPPDMPVREVAARMVAEEIHRVFVVEGKKLLGVISTFDLARAIATGRVADA